MILHFVFFLIYVLVTKHRGISYSWWFSFNIFSKFRDQKFTLMEFFFQFILHFLLFKLVNNGERSSKSTSAMANDHKHGRRSSSTEMNNAGHEISHPGTDFQKTVHSFLVWVYVQNTTLSNQINTFFSTCNAQTDLCNLDLWCFIYGVHGWLICTLKICKPAHTHFGYCTISTFLFYILCWICWLLLLLMIKVKMSFLNFAKLFTWPNDYVTSLVIWSKFDIWKILSDIESNKLHTFYW